VRTRTAASLAAAALVAALAGCADTTGSDQAATTPPTTPTATQESPPETAAPPTDKISGEWRFAAGNPSDPVAGRLFVVVRIADETVEIHGFTAQSGDTWCADGRIDGNGADLGAVRIDLNDGVPTFPGPVADEVLRPVEPAEEAQAFDFYDYDTFRTWC